MNFNPLMHSTVGQVFKKKPTKQNPQQSKQNQTNAMILKNVLQGEIQCLWRNNIQEMDMLQNDQ